MPTPNWIGKEAAVKHHKEVPFRLLEPVPELSCASPRTRSPPTPMPLKLVCWKLPAASSKPSATS